MSCQLVFSPCHTRTDTDFHHDRMPPSSATAGASLEYDIWTASLIDVMAVDRVLITPRA